MYGIDLVDAVRKVIQSFLYRNPSDIEKHGFAGSAQSLPDIQGGSFWIETLQVDPPGPQRQILHAGPAKITQRAAGRSEIEQGEAVEPAHIGPQRSA
ncbi:hypothetical protein D3C72_2077280 [compost metagenome]